VILPMLKPVMVSVVLQAIVQPPVLPAAHRVAVCFSMILIAMEVTMLKVVVIPLMGVWLPVLPSRCLNRSGRCRRPHRHCQCQCNSVHEITSYVNWSFGRVPETEWEV